MTDILIQIEMKLRSAFTPNYLIIENESDQHTGHSGAAEHKSEYGDTPSHIHIEIEADAFQGLSRLARHRAVLDAVPDEIAQLHAVRMTIRTPA